jgi:hypothetical protein
VAAAGREQPSQGAEQRRLPAAVGADHRGDGAVEDIEVEVVDDDVVAVGELQAAGLQTDVVGSRHVGHRATSRRRRTSAMKKGAPINASTMPT